MEKVSEDQPSEAAPAFAGGKRKNQYEKAQRRKHQSRYEFSGARRTAASECPQPRKDRSEQDDEERTERLQLTQEVQFVFRSAKGFGVEPACSKMAQNKARNRTRTKHSLLEAENSVRDPAAWQAAQVDGGCIA